MKRGMVELARLSPRECCYGGIAGGGLSLSFASSFVIGLQGCKILSACSLVK